MADTPEASSRRWPIVLIFAVALGWWTILAALALFSANPITINREQIQRADFVVTATVVDKTAGVVHVEKEWKSAADFHKLTVKNLEDTLADSDATWLIPLTRSPDGHFQVPASRLPNGEPLVYPATPEATKQLADILKRQ